MSYRSNLVWVGAIALGASLLGVYGRPAPGASQTPVNAGPLSGTWMTNDRGKITLQQTGNQIVWKCISSYDGGKTFTHTFRGKLVGNIIQGHFFDHAPGANRNSGDLTFEVDRPVHLKLVKNSGAFGAYSIEKISDSVEQSGTENLEDFSHDLVPESEKNR